MANLRSPNCPAITLQEALDRGRRVYEEEHTHPADRNVIAQDLGYSVLSGPAATVIAALRQYGILEGRGEGMHITEDAVAAFELPDDSPDKRFSLSRMAFRPALFRELQAQFGDRLPGEANLRHHLIKKGFLPDRADDVARTYRDNLELVTGQSGEYNMDQKQVDMQTASTPDQKPQPSPASVPPLAPQANASVRQDVFSLNEGPVTIQWPASISPESFEDLGSWLDIVKRKIGRSVAKKNKPTPVNSGDSSMYTDKG